MSDKFAPSATKKLLASVVLLAAIFFLCLGLVGLLSADNTSGFLVAGVAFVGGGLVLLRWAVSLWRGRPGMWRLAQGRTPEEARAMSRERARAQWLVAARFLLVLTGVYLLLALLLTSGHAALGAAAVAAMASGSLGVLSWWQGQPRRSR